MAYVLVTGGPPRGAPPAPGNPLLKLDNVVSSPHSAALTEECTRRMTDLSVRNILDVIDGRLDAAFVVNKEILG